MKGELSQSCLTKELALHYIAISRDWSARATDLNFKQMVLVPQPARRSSPRHLLNSMQSADCFEISTN